jgi:hypothetical protein
MKEETTPQARIFVCINEKAPGKTACLKGEGDKCVTWLKEELRNRQLSSRIWVTKTRCQGYCVPDGTSLLFMPTNKQYSSVKFEDVPRLLEGFLAQLESANKS